MKKSYFVFMKQTDMTTFKLMTLLNFIRKNKRKPLQFIFAMGINGTKMRRKEK